MALLTSARVITDRVLASDLSPLISTTSPAASVWNHRRFHRFRSSERFSNHIPPANGPPAEIILFPRPDDPAEPHALTRIEPASLANRKPSSVISFAADASAMA